MAEYVITPDGPRAKHRHSPPPSANSSPRGSGRGGGSARRSRGGGRGGGGGVASGGRGSPPHPHPIPAGGDGYSELGRAYSAALAAAGSPACDTSPASSSVPTTPAEAPREHGRGGGGGRGTPPSSAGAAGGTGCCARRSCVLAFSALQEQLHAAAEERSMLVTLKNEQLRDADATRRKDVAERDAVIAEQDAQLAAAAARICELEARVQDAERRNAGYQAVYSATEEEVATMMALMEAKLERYTARGAVLSAAHTELGSIGDGILRAARVVNDTYTFHDQLRAHLAGEMDVYDGIKRALAGSTQESALLEALTQRMQLKKAMAREGVAAVPRADASTAQVGAPELWRDAQITIPPSIPPDSVTSSEGGSLVDEEEMEGNAAAAAALRQQCGIINTESRQSSRFPTNSSLDRTSSGVRAAAAGDSATGRQYLQSYHPSASTDSTWLPLHQVLKDAGIGDSDESDEAGGGGGVGAADHCLPPPQLSPAAAAHRSASPVGSMRSCMSDGSAPTTAANAATAATPYALPDAPVRLPATRVESVNEDPTAAQPPAATFTPPFPSHETPIAAFTSKTKVHWAGGAGTPPLPPSTTVTGRSGDVASGSPLGGAIASRFGEGVAATRGDGGGASGAAAAEAAPSPAPPQRPRREVPDMHSLLAAWRDSSMSPARATAPPTDDVGNSADASPAYLIDRYDESTLQKGGETVRELLKWTKRVLGRVACLEEAVTGLFELHYESLCAVVAHPSQVDQAARALCDDLHFANSYLSERHAALHRRLERALASRERYRTKFYDACERVDTTNPFRIKPKAARWGGRVDEDGRPVWIPPGYHTAAGCHSVRKGAAAQDAAAAGL